MLTNSKFALSLMFVLATASAAMAAPKQPVRPSATIQQQVPVGSHLSLDSVLRDSFGRSILPTYRAPPGRTVQAGLTDRRTKAQVDDR
jgi:hypothetical protein